MDDASKYNLVSGAVILALLLVIGLMAYSSPLPKLSDPCPAPDDMFGASS